MWASRFESRPCAIKWITPLSVREYPGQDCNCLFGGLPKPDPGCAEALVLGKEVDAILFVDEKKNKGMFDAESLVSCG